MSTQKLLFTTVAATLLNGGIVIPASAHSDPYGPEVENCIAKVYEHLDLNDAERVRHLVSLIDHKGSARGLKIETSVYTASHSYSYASRCLTTRSGVPVKFSITPVANFG